MNAEKFGILPHQKYVNFFADIADKIAQSTQMPICLDHWVQPQFAHTAQVIYLIPNWADKKTFLTRNNHLNMPHSLKVTQLLNWTRQQDSGFLYGCPCFTKSFSAFLESLFPGLIWHNDSHISFQYQKIKSSTDQIQ